MKKAVALSLRKDVPDFRIGDTVKVNVRIVEGEKERTQAYTGVVISRRGSGMSEMFTVRRIVNNEGVERVFPLNNPKIAGIEVVRGGKVRRAKLYYLQGRVGKSTRLKDTKEGADRAAVSEAAVEQAAKVAAAAAAEAAPTEADAKAKAKAKKAAPKKK